VTPFARGLAAEIAANGPIPLDRWMALCNAHYYATRDPLGRDFTTAPEISQVFGELIGLWAADLWQRAGAPPRVALVELGPGRGTLMADALRATARVSGFLAARTVHLVETSPVLRATQATRVPDAIWHAAIDALPTDAPLIVLANEFLDALPVEQSLKTSNNWRARTVGTGANGLEFAAGASVARPPFAHAPPGTVHECSPVAEAVAVDLAQRVAAQGGAALFVDYGHTTTVPGDTLQAVRDGTRVPPLAYPGDSDLTAHVDFAAIAAATHPHARIHGPTTQSQFLARLGLAERTHALAGANPTRAAALHAAAARLTAPVQMGALFKVLALTHPNWPTPAGF